MKRPAREILPLAVPVLVLLALTVLPLALGQRTLFLRDLFNVHLAMKAEQARALQGSEDGTQNPALPLIAPGLAGGQPLLGNPNSVPLYPTQLLYLFAPVLWALNAHLWLHLLLAPWAFYWLGRAWGLRREAAWAAGVAYGFSGFLVSHLNFTNLIAVATLTPALCAAALRLTEPRLTEPTDTGDTADSTKKPPRARYAAALGVLWALLLLGGEPVLAVLALALALTGVLVREGRGAWTLGHWRQRLRSSDGEDSTWLSGAWTSGAWTSGTWIAGAWTSGWAPLVLAVLCGSLIALPQIVETLRILPISYRGHQGFSADTRTLSSFHPLQTLDWFLPMCFGRFDLLRYGSFWGGPFYSELPPFFFSLYPGLLTLALIAISGWRRAARHTLWPSRLWAWLLVAGGLFFSMGRYNPVAEFLLGLPGLDMLRYPVKLMLPVTIGAALLAGLGFERVLTATSEVRQRLRLLLLLLTLGYLLAWAWLTFAPDAAFGLLRGWVPTNFPDDFVSHERLRWAGLALLNLVVLALLLAAVAVLRKRPRLGAALLLLVHAGAQLYLLRPAMPTDDADAYRTPPPLLRYVPADARVVHGTEDGTFGRRNYPGSYPEPTAAWQQRRAFYELYSVSGVFHDRRYELNMSPEGLSSFLTRAAHDLMPQLDDAQRLRLLESWGVTHVILNRPLDDDALGPNATRPNATGPIAALRALLQTHDRHFELDIFVYRLPMTTPEVFHVGTVHRAPHLNAAVENLLRADFDPRAAAVLPGDGISTHAAAGRVHILSQGPEHLEVEVDAVGAGALVWQRVHLPIYRASIDGEDTRVRVANLHRIAVETPPGRHVVRIETDRRPLHQALLASLLGVLGLLFLASRLRRA